MSHTNIRPGAKVTRSIVAENVYIDENATVGAPASGDSKDIATIGNNVRIGAGATIGPKAMVKEDVKEGETQC
jgi:glucose-1-phosphate adenylyltransferase